jgi:transcriptional regulator with PAS, ATPase and Fis domain
MRHPAVQRAHGDPYEIGKFRYTSQEEVMKPRLCIVGGRLIINIAEKVASEFSNSAEFLFIPHLLEDALPYLRRVEGDADIVIAGPSTMRICSKSLAIPVISYRPTFPDVIRAIQEARNFDNRIVICLSPDDRDFDLPLLSQIMDVSLFPSYCETFEDYANACRISKEKDYRVVIGGSFTVSAAEKIGVKGVSLYKGMDMLRTAVKKALEIYYIHHEGLRRISQLTAVVNNFTEGLILTDEKGRIIFDNPPAQRYLRCNELQGKRLYNLFSTQLPLGALKKGEKILNVVEKGNLVVNYVPVSSEAEIHGLVCTIKKVDEIQDAEFTVRRKLHDRGFMIKYTLDDIVGQSQAIHQCKERATLFASGKAPILITGESGTGKELFAHSIHALSDQRGGPFVAINCATLPSELLESELFGYEKGAFTGAHTAGKKGLIELAHRGTLFLDEITSLSYPLQAKLLRLLSEHEILKLGSDRIIPVDIRIIAATNIDIESCVEAHKFRDDLYYRLSAFRLHIPPLRERVDDLIPLFQHFIHSIRDNVVGQVARQKKIIQSVLAREPLKGNVRELENIAKRFCLLYSPEKNGKEIGTLLESCLEKKMISYEPDETPTDLKRALELTEKKIIQDVVKKYKNKNDVSRILDVNRSTLWRKLKRYGISE